MQDDLAYRYFAFISYSSKDKKVAEKIHDRIESYRLPTVLRNELEAANGKELPQSLSPLFLDMTNLPAGQLLAESILKELQDSRFLLVICTPNSAKSEWVNQEVENFILMGRYERVILYIIKGIPNSGDPKTECFPPILRQKRVFITYSIMSNEENAKRHADLHSRLDSIHDELKGVSYSGEGPEISLIKVIARMLEIRPDALIKIYQEQQKQKKKKTPWIIMIALFFLVLFSCLGFWTWDRYYRVHVGYFADYVEYWGVPRGIFPLTAEQRAHREGHYRIYTRNRKVTRLEHVNSACTPIPVEDGEFKDRPMIAVYPIYKDGRLVQRDSLDRNGRVLISYHYSGDRMQKVEFKSLSNDGTASPVFLSDNTISMGGHGVIGNMRLVRDDEGRVIEERFQKGSYDVPATDTRGIAGFRYILDDYGRIIEKNGLDLDGNSHLNFAARYDEQGNLVESIYRGKKHIRTFDNYGNTTEDKIVNPSDELCSRKFKYDDQGNRIEEACFGIDGKPCPISSYKGYSKRTWNYDEQGNQIEEVYYGIDGRIYLNRDGYAKVTWKYDEQGNKTEYAYWGIDGKPCLTHKSYTKVTLKYDERGNTIEEAYFGIDGKPCLYSFHNYTKLKNKYDNCGKVIEQAYFGLDGEPCLCENCYAKITVKYDERGNETETAYWDIDGKPCLFILRGYAKRTWKYDERGNRIECAFFGVDGEPCLDKYMGCARESAKYDEYGNMTEWACFGIDGQPCLCKNGYAKIIKGKYFDIDGKPVKPRFR